jgi:hypothetical protein
MNQEPHVNQEQSDGLRLFDWQSNWSEVETILVLPKVRESYEIVMRSICRKKGIEWNSTRPPIEYGDAPPRELSDHSANQYRCFGACYPFNVFAGTIGEIIEPELQWRIVFPAILTPGYHAVAIGFGEIVQDGEREALRSPTLMMDLNFAPDGPMDEFNQENEAYAILRDHVHTFGGVQSRGLPASLSLMRSALEADVA